MEKRVAVDEETVVVPPPPVVEQAGDRIGRFKLLQQIGEGGCGVVYMAEQEEPVRRRVALKVIKLGMDTKSVIARFEAERQALALMDHPNIAKVLDAGATASGRPFFVMELVRGLKITEYCDENKLPTKERLRLFVQVCQAIQHAHQKGIIHRDIKPSNILVTLHDTAPVPKVIDFGIAKATQGRLTDQTLFTAFEQFIGTPAYMSPEQAELSGLDVDTRSDIYALGVLLYELLTGRTPFDTKQLMASGLDKLRQTLREAEPERPSTRLRTMLSADLSSAAQARHTDAPKLIHLVRGDLDWIVMKALEKDRTRRYETANGLAMDVQRYLDHEPVAARPPSSLYRFQKMVRRHKVVVGAVGAVVLALATGFGLSTYLFIQERAARQRAVAAEREQARLRRQAETALQLQAQLRQEKDYSEKLDSAGRALSEGRYEDAEKLLLQVPRHAASASLYNALGLAFARRGDWPEALTNFRTLTEIAPAEQLPYSFVAALLAQAGDLPAYRRHCEHILAQFGTTRAPTTAERMAKACLVAPGVELSSITKLVAVARPLEANRALADDFKFVKGLAEYRQQHLAAAASWLGKIDLPEGQSWRAVQVDMVLAMTQWRLGQEENARATLAQGLHLAESDQPKIKVRDLGPAWIDRVIAQALMHEAQQVIPTSGR
jgi:tetratricopeptide (TPR) repeat protein